MKCRIFAVGLCTLGASLGALGALPSSARAQGKPKPHLVTPRKPPKKISKKIEPEAEKPATDTPGEPGVSEDKTAGASDKPDKAEPNTVKAAGTNTTKVASGVSATVSEDKSGVKTYKFGKVEVEGRMKSPQIIYFLRRVRAEFDAGLLGHRSFMRELSDTRNQSSFR